MLYFALVRSKLEYTSVAWKSVTITDFNKLERVQRKFAALCHNWKQSAFVCLLGTYVTLPISAAPSARCVAAANAVCKFTDIFS
jgi:hypothetical protein